MNPPNLSAFFCPFNWKEGAMVSESGPVSANDRESYRAFEVEEQMEDQTWRRRDAEQLLCSAGVPVYGRFMCHVV